MSKSISEEIIDRNTNKLARGSPLLLTSPLQLIKKRDGCNGIVNTPSTLDTSWLAVLSLHVVTR